MNRLQKKCVIASGGFHLLLVLILFIGPGFLSSKTAAPDVPVLAFIPAKTVDELVAPSGGERSAKPPPTEIEAPKPPPPEPPEPQPSTPEPKPEPEPQKEVAKDPTPVKPETESLVPTDKPKPRKPDVSTTLVTRKPDAEAKAQADAKAKQQAERQRQLAKAFNNAVDQIGSGLSGEVSVKFNNGPGPAGVSYANFLQAVKSAYMRALVTPDNLNDENAVTVASVTIARDGTVVSARIVHLSGDDQLDRAVQRTLDRVKYAAPLPDSATEDQRTVEINFNAKAKRGFG